MQIKGMVNDFFEFKKDCIANQAFVAFVLGFNCRFLGQISFFVEGVLFEGQEISEGNYGVLNSFKNLTKYFPDFCFKL